MTFSRKLTAQCFDGISTEPPPEDSLFWKMWKNSKDIAERSLNTDYIQGIKKGTLSPNSYGYSTVNDAYYCFEGPDNYHKAAQRTDDFALKKYLLALEKSYRDYNEDFVTNWHLKDASSIKPIQVCLMTNCAKVLLISNSVSYWKRYNSVYCYTMVLNMYF